MATAHDVEILLVEDNPRDVELTLRALKRHNLGNRVVTAKDGAEALDFLFARGDFAGRSDESQPKVVFLDLKMPKIDGLEVLRQIRSNERTKTLPVVVMTSSREEQDIVEAYKLGVNSYVVKPMEFEQFAKTIAELGYYWVATNQPPPHV
ncbi:MAG: two-component system response regulator [Candidatus Handelsmanbacteria bacterium RIFCSPLOWO2_12_FULL_64_10]|uniref:Two-component system response regulator n=1 Tax=Handelsmanbacteria sp. (strain RIFCSPLOWO2_12_FULL_64_10) TaxID=1817868 RepID=A0A1F6CZ09_HANXR|nr:MAG: two-component system response regulator [Candidatus Handelsmanbacteria bacterium RIFCSPLOWO2_12_FULL_64_10]